MYRSFFLSLRKNPALSFGFSVVWSLAMQVNVVCSQPAQPQDFDLEKFCREFPLNSRCQDPANVQPPKDIPQERETTKVIKLKLNSLSGVSEWIRAEVNGSDVKLLHTVVSESGLSKVATSAATGFLGIPLPFPIGHSWYDHPTSRILFKPDGCEASDCMILGQDVVSLPVGMDLYQGQFTMEYKESNWVRTVTFKFPR